MNWGLGFWFRTSCDGSWTAFIIVLRLRGLKFEAKAWAIRVAGSKAARREPAHRVMEL